MKIVIAKKENANPVLTCTRRDGSVTWKLTDPFFVAHDICHYAVETVLALQQGFYGLLAAGTDISGFDRPAGQRNVVITAEAVFSEQLVNLFMIDHRQGKISDISAMIGTLCPPGTREELLRSVTNERIENIRKKYASLLEEWEKTAPGDSLQLTYGE